MVRPGRLDKLLYVDLPTAEERVEIVKTLTTTRRVPLPQGAEAEAFQVAVDQLFREKGEGYSGADLASVVREAGVIALKRTLGTLDIMEESGNGQRPDVVVGYSDFVIAVEKIGPSVSMVQRKRYEALRSKLSGSPVRMQKEDAKISNAAPVDTGAVIN